MERGGGGMAWGMMARGTAGTGAATFQTSIISPFSKSGQSNLWWGFFLRWQRGGAVMTLGW